MEIKEEKYDFIIKMVLATFIGSGLLYGVVLILSLAIKKPITLGESLSYFGAVLTAVVTIFGVMWQIEKNNETNKKNDLSLKRNIYLYFQRCLNKSLEKLKYPENAEKEIIYEKFFNLKRHHYKRNENWFYEFDKSFIDKNLEKILSLEEGHSILEVNDFIKEMNSYINNRIKIFIPKEYSKKIDMFEFENSKSTKFTEENLAKLALIKEHFFLLNMLNFTYLSDENNLIQCLAAIEELKRLYNSSFLEKQFVEFKNRVMTLYLTSNIESSYEGIFNSYKKQVDFIFELLTEIMNKGIAYGIYKAIDLENLKEILREEHYNLLEFELIFKLINMMKSLKVQIENSLSKQD